MVLLFDPLDSARFLRCRYRSVCLYPGDSLLRCAGNIGAYRIGFHLYSNIASATHQDGGAKKCGS